MNEQDIHDAILANIADIIDTATDDDDAQEQLAAYEELLDSPERMAALAGELGAGREESLAQGDAPGWVRYEGPKHGHGWKSTKTGVIIYQEEMPGEHEHGEGDSAGEQGGAAKEPWQMTREEFRNDMTIGKIPDTGKGIRHDTEVYLTQVLPKTFKVYREVVVSAGGTPNLDDPGTSWAETPRGASKGVTSIKGKSVILEADADRDDIDVARSVASRMRYGEPEINFKKPLKARVSERSNSHKIEVERALASGKPVPPEVLADYPDLASPREEMSQPDDPLDAIRRRVRKLARKRYPEKP